MEETRQNYNTLKHQDIQIFDLSKTLKEKITNNNTLENKIEKKTIEARDFISESKQLEDSLKIYKNKINNYKEDMNTNFFNRNKYLVKYNDESSQQILYLEEETMRLITDAKNNILDLQNKHQQCVEKLKESYTKKI
jgi:hypothetical protein